MRENERRLGLWERDYDLRGEHSEPTVFRGNVTGLTYHEYWTYSQRLKAGGELIVRPDPANKFDANATGLFFQDPEQPEVIPAQIGWIPKALNRVAARAAREGYTLRAKILSHIPFPNGNDAVLNCIVFIDRKDLPTEVPIQPSQEITSMSKLTAIAQKNIDLGASAAFLEAGRIANNQLSSIASKKLPIMVRAYADTALGRLLLANVALMARDHFRPNDERLGKLVNAMTVSAYQEVLQNFDVEQMIDDLVANSTIKKALKTIDAQPAAD